MYLMNSSSISFDLDQPSPVDDEYWESSLHNPAFSQPPDKPSLIDFFNCQLNLNRILSFTLKVFVRIPLIYRPSIKSVGSTRRTGVDL